MSTTTDVALDFANRHWNKLFAVFQSAGQAFNTVTHPLSSSTFQTPTVDIVQTLAQNQPVTILIYLMLMWFPMWLFLRLPIYWGKALVIGILLGILLVGIFYRWINKPKSPWDPNVDPEAQHIIQDRFADVRKYHPDAYKKAQAYLNRFFRLYGRVAKNPKMCIHVAEHQPGVPEQKWQRTLLIQNPIFRRATLYQRKCLLWLGNLKFQLPNDLFLEKKVEMGIKHISTLCDSYRHAIARMCNNDMCSTSIIHPTQIDHTSSVEYVRMSQHAYKDTNSPV